MWAWFPCGSYNGDQLSELWGVSSDEEGEHWQPCRKKHLTLPSLFQDAWSVNKLGFLMWELNWTLPPYNKNSIWICKRTRKHTNLEKEMSTSLVPRILLVQVSSAMLPPATFPFVILYLLFESVLVPCQIVPHGRASPCSVSPWSLLVFEFLAPALVLDFVLIWIFSIKTVFF